MEGWISIHRGLTNKGYYKDSHYVHLWLHLLIKATYCDREYLWNGEMMTLKRGQFITGRKALQEETGINESKIERILKLFENEQQIKQETTTKYRLITILNWDKHQGEDKKVNNKRTTSEQQVNTNNKGNKDNKNTASQSSALVVELIKAFEGINPACKGYYGNTTQRKACDDLIQEYGFDQVLKVISETLPKTNQLQFFPKILTPHQLWTDYAKLAAKISEYKKPKSTPNVIFS